LDEIQDLKSYTYAAVSCGLRTLPITSLGTSKENSDEHSAAWKCEILEIVTALSSA
jgi:hypothetical protein